ncbi:MAG: DUF4159 domain-containing protein [Opitutaceae bacterium]|nr:DUF4159 domain-containing protein [Opitutaceae bacterium]
MRAPLLRRWSGLIVLSLAAIAAGAVVFAQGRFFRGGPVYVPPGTRTARELGTRSTGTPDWDNPSGFHADVFTFARLRYDAAPRPPTSRRGGWTTDLPDADLNLSYRLQQLTSLRVDPNARLVRPTDPDLAEFPFLFASAPGAMGLTAGEIVALRTYLLNGGFMLMTDFWGDADLEYVERLFKEILPGSRFEELPIEHPLYRMVVNIREKAQVPNIHIGLKIPNTQIHHRVIFDAKGRIMVMGLHNSDDSDGWEREGENHEYFEKYAEKIAYPLAINIIVYVMTH